MFRSYLTVALRNIFRHKLFSLINIFGLTVGLVSVMFVTLFVRDELSFDNWIPGTENLYRMEITFHVSDRPPMAFAMIMHPLPKALLTEIPGVTAQTIIGHQTMTLTSGDRQFSEMVSVVDPGFFTVIRLPFVQGDPAAAFNAPQSIVLSQSAARKYFGNDNPIGRTLSTVRSNCDQADLACQHTMIPLTVTGVIRDLPHNTQLTGDIFLPNTSLADISQRVASVDWISNNEWGFVRLAPGVDPNSVVARAAPIFDREVTPELKAIGMKGMGGQVATLHLTPFTRVHLDSSRWTLNMTPAGSWTTVYGVAAIGGLILAIACFNFMNLSTARAALRSREIALRKTLGAKRGQVIMQFLGEAVLMAVLALVFAFAFVEVLLPRFDAFLDRPIAFDYVADWTLVLAFAGVAVLAGLISGVYPAFVLSAFRPATALKSEDSQATGSGLLRNGLVVLQFAASIGLGIAALVVFSQISYARTIDLGFQSDNVLMIGSGRLNYADRDAFLRALRAYPGIDAVGASTVMPFDDGQSLGLIKLPGQSQALSFNEINISPDFPKVYGIKLLAGRLLSEDRVADQMHSTLPTGDPLNEGHNLLINATGARQLGLTPADAVGKTVIFNQGPVRIVGVLADVKMHGALEPVKPTLYAYVPTAWMNFSVRLRPDMVPQTLVFIDQTWRRYSPVVSIERRFTDDVSARLYQEDERQGEMFGVSVIIAICVACLGLFGLAAFTAGRRTREIGVRKVFGARTGNVMRLLLWQFTIPVLIANAIAWPAAWYYLDGWLKSFAYHIDLNPLYFVAVGVAALVIAWVTVVVHTWRVARANPIKALRYE